MDKEQRANALIAMHLYEALDEYINAGLDDEDGLAANLLDRVYDHYDNAFMELAPLINRI